MWKKAKKSLAFLLAVAMMVSLINSEQLFVSAENTAVAEEETEAEAVSAEEEAAPEEAAADAPVEEQTETVEEPAGEAPTEEEPGADPVEGDSAALEEKPQTGTPTDATVTEQPAEENPAGQPGTEEEEPGETEEPGASEEVPGETEESGASEEKPGETEEPGASEEVPGESEEPGNTETLPDGTVTGEETELPAEEEGAPAEELPAEEEISEEEEPALCAAAVYTASVRDMEVKVSAPDDALPEGSELVVEEVHSQDVETAIQENEVAYEGYVALDIHFELNGKEVEPLLPVAVTMALNNVIPEEAEATEIHHLVEDEQGNVESVDKVSPDESAIVSEGESDVKPEDVPEETESDTVIVAFETESFSVFVITWTITSEDQVKIELPVTIQPVDAEGNSLGDGITADISVDKQESEPAVLNAIVTEKEIEEIRANGHTYQFDYAAVGGLAESFASEELNAGFISSEVREQPGNGYWDHGQYKRSYNTITTYYYGVWSGNQSPTNIDQASVIAYRSYTKTVSKTQVFKADGWQWLDIAGTEKTTVSEPSELTTKRSVYLVYEQQPDNIMEHTDAIHLDKYVEADGDGNFTLTLSSYITGTVGGKIIPTDFVLVLDRSGSMTWGFGEPVYLKDLNIEKAQKYGNTRNYNSYYTTASPDSDEKAGNNSAVYYSNGQWMANYSPLNGNTKVYVRRIGALKEASCAFVDELYAQDASGAYKVSVVSYGSDSDIDVNLTALDSPTNVALIKDEINKINAEGSTYSNKGMENANTELRSMRSREEAGKVAVLFTDGGPGYSGWGGNDAISTANGAIAAAYKIKAPTATNVGVGQRGLGGKVYSISITDDADPSTIGDNMNKYMNYVSSNYPNVQSMGENNANREEGADYYKAARDVTALVEAFKEAGGGTPGISLDASATVQDYLAANFQLQSPQDPESNITVYTQNATGYSNGSYTFDGNNQLYSAGVSVEDGTTIKVNGFNYADADNYVKGEGSEVSGRMLVVKVAIKFDDENCFGGNNIPTNTGDTAIYADADGDGVLDKVKAYPQPLVNIPVDYEATSQDQTIYVTNNASLNDMLAYVTEGTKSYLPNGINNRYVDIVYSFSAGTNTYYYKIPAQAEAASGRWYSDAACQNELKVTSISGITECVGYTVKCQVSPISAPHEDDAGRLAVGEAAITTGIEPNPTLAMVHVLYPKVKCTDLWTEIGDSQNLQEAIEVTGWYDPKDSVGTEASAAGTAPTVNVGFKEYGKTETLSNSIVTLEKDTDYSLVVKVKETDVTEKADITKDQQTEDGNGHSHISDCYDHADADKHSSDSYDFRVHPMGYRLTVIKNVTGNMGDKTKSFDFTYRKGSAAAKPFDLENTESYVIEKIKPGTMVTVVEDGTYNASGINQDGYQTTIAVAKGGIPNTSEASATYQAEITKNTTITYDNHKEINPPSGIVKDTMPYLLMLLASLGAVVCFFITRRRRV
ncbi:MAG: VWA domain-containing protein [Clostridiales bacterium]|nr:VWA domain-containing protein [Clostridiales bacterium]